MRTIHLTRKMIPARASNRPGAKLNSTGGLYVTVHETGNTRPGAGAAMHANFVYNGGGTSNVSFHFTVDHLGAYQMLPCDEIAYHASDGCDNRNTDLGCFASVAIETCVDSGNVNKVQTRENLIALISMIITGHPSIDYGSVKPARFSADRIRTHNDWAYDKKWCPTYMLNDGYVPRIAPLVRANIGNVTPAPTPVPESTFKIGDRLKATDRLNVRQGYGTDYKIVKTLDVGDEVQVVADDAGHFAIAADGYTWVNIKANGGSGWAAGDWLERTKEPVPPPAPKRPSITLRYPLPLRTSPGFNGKITGELKAGTTGTVLAGPDEANGLNWYKVEIPGVGQGYVPQGIMWAVEIK